MNKTIYYGLSRKYIFYTVLLGSVVLLLYSIFFKPSALSDFAVSIVFFAILYYFGKKYKISIGAFLLVSVAILSNLFGSFGLYAYFVLFGIIGYDKLVHFTSGFAVSYAILQVITEKKTLLRFVFVILVAMGLGALVEINEFIGTRYFGINNGGIFAIGDGLPVIKSDLQKYDTYYDMIFNFAGALMCAFFVSIQNHYSQG